MKNPFSAIRLFYQETMTELKKSTWPNRSELVQSTLVVLVAIAIVGAFIVVADFSLSETILLLTEWAR